LIGFFQQQRGARQWRRTLSSIDRSMSDAIGLVEQALAAVEPQDTDELSLQSLPGGVESVAGVSTADHISGTVLARN